MKKLLGLVVLGGIAGAVAYKLSKDKIKAVKVVYQNGEEKTLCDCGCDCKEECTCEEICTCGSECNCNDNCECKTEKGE